MKHILFGILALMLLVGCPEDPDTQDAGVIQLGGTFPSLGKRSKNRLIILTASYTNKIGWVEEANLAEGSRRRSTRPISADPWARIAGNDIIVVNRNGPDNLQFFNLPTLFFTGRQQSVKEWNESVDIGGSSLVLPANARDIAVVGKRLYLTRYNARNLLWFDRLTLKYQGQLSLADFADPEDTFPEMDRMTLVDGKIWVQLQRLNGKKTRDAAIWPPVPPSLLAVIDPKDDSVSTIPLTTQNPVSELVWDGASKVYVASAGQYTLTDAGGIEVVDTKTRATKVLLKEADLKRQLFELAVGPDRGWALSYDDKFETSLLRFDTATGAILHHLPAAPKSPFQTLTYDAERDLLYVAVRNLENPRIEVRDGESGKVLAEFPVSFPPVQILLVE